jgi:hypothetical protein
MTAFGTKQQSSAPILASEVRRKAATQSMR